MHEPIFLDLVNTVTPQSILFIYTFTDIFMFLSFNPNKWFYSTDYILWHYYSGVPL